LRPVGPAQRAPLEALVRATRRFRETEVATAVELLDEAVAGDDDYRFIGAYEGEALVGYACWGPTPGTVGTHDLYWIAVDPSRQGRGVGAQLLRHVEQALSADGGRLLVAETSGRTDYAPTRTFYEKHGFIRSATVAAYYAPGDDLLIYTKDLANGDLARTAS
jgi:ribosomal protein S18 acetylase RimI-like enzyme